MKTILNRLINHEQLTKEEAHQVLVAISEGKYNNSQISAFLTVYMMHGNYGVSSISGSSNVLEQLGVSFSNQQDHLQQCLDKSNICILHAPLFHPAMKNVAPIRRELGVKTFFNMLGPMVNPANPKNQVVGVFNLELARKYGYLYQKGSKNFAILHAIDGYDEISLTGPVKMISNTTETMLNPASFSVNKIEASQIYGGTTVEASAHIFYDILNNQGTEAQNHVVCQCSCCNFSCKPM